MVGLTAQLKCNYTNARSMGNNQELEAIVQQENYDIADITERGRDIAETGELQWMTINSSEGIDKEEEVVG